MQATSYQTWMHTTNQIFNILTLKFYRIMKKERKDWAQLDVNALEEIRKERDELKEKCEVMARDAASMTEEFVRLKKEISSLKGQNTRLKRDVERYKQLDCEGDKLNEKRIKEIDYLKDMLEEAKRIVGNKQKVIDGLNDQTMELRGAISQQESQIKDLRGELGAYEANTEWFNGLPWWRKAFTKL